MNGELYYKRFVEFFGICGEHWKNDTWASRERALRHHMVCTLLCNTTLNKRAPPTDPQPSTIERSKYETELDYYMDCEEEGSESEFVEDPSLIMNDSRYRFLCLEGQENTSVHMIQRRYAQSWGVPAPGKKWDIIDKQVCFVEVKISSNSAKCFAEFDNNTIMMKSHSSIIVIHPNTITTYTRGIQIDFRGKCKAIYFLSRREIYMRKHNLFETDSNEVDELESYMFCDPRTNREVV